MALPGPLFKCPGGPNKKCRKGGPNAPQNDLLFRAGNLSKRTFWGPWALLGSRWGPSYLQNNPKSTYFGSKFRQSTHSCSYYKIPPSKNGQRSALYFYVLGHNFCRQSSRVGNKFGAQTAERHGGGYGRRHWIYMYILQYIYIVYVYTIYIYIYICLCPFNVLAPPYPGKKMSRGWGIGKAWGNDMFIATFLSYLELES